MERRMTIQSAKITAEQFHHIREPAGFRLELVDGELVVSPSPRPRHSNTAINLIAILHAYIEANNLGRLFTELDTEFDAFNVRRPDLLFVPGNRAEQLDPDSAATSNDPELVIEVISPGSAETDREKKFKQYAAAGIAYYWIVDPNLETFESFTLVGKKYRPHVKGKGNATVQAKPFPDLAIPLQKLWWPK
jgi:Uma2 family endonuclease